MAGAKTDVEAVRRKIVEQLAANGSGAASDRVELNWSEARALLAHSDKLAVEVESLKAVTTGPLSYTAMRARADAAETKLAALTEAGTCKGDDSGHILAFLNGLHAHLPEDERPTSWMQFSDDQRERIKKAWGQMVNSLTDTQASGGREEAVIPDFLKRQTGELPPAPTPELSDDDGREGRREGLSDADVLLSLSPVPAGDVTGIDAAMMWLRDQKIIDHNNGDGSTLSPSNKVRNACIDRLIAALSAPPLGEGLRDTMGVAHLTAIERAHGERAGMEAAMGKAFCNTCGAFPRHGYCNLKGCPMPRPEGSDHG